MVLIKGNLSITNKDKLQKSTYFYYSKAENGL